MTKITVIIAAAGNSERMGGKCNKVLLKLLNKTVIEYSLAVFSQAAAVNNIIIAAAAEDIVKITAIASAYPKVSAVIIGGATRSQSVMAALAVIDEDCDYIAVHDAARPLLSKNDLQALITAAKSGAAILATPIIDTIKEISDDTIINTPDRNSFVAAQTPQIFAKEIILGAYRQIGNQIYTDDASVVEAAGFPVKVVIAKDTNSKITTGPDLALAELVLKSRKDH